MTLPPRLCDTTVVIFLHKQTRVATSGRPTASHLHPSTSGTCPHAQPKQPCWPAGGARGKGLPPPALGIQSGDVTFRKIWKF